MLAYLQLPILSAKEADARRAKGGGTRGCARARSPRIFRSDAETIEIVGFKIIAAKKKYNYYAVLYLLLRG